MHKQPALRTRQGWFLSCKNMTATSVAGYREGSTFSQVPRVPPVRCFPMCESNSHSVLLTGTEHNNGFVSKKSGNVEGPR